jgi:hypothetical protein
MAFKRTTTAEAARWQRGDKIVYIGKAEYLCSKVVDKANCPRSDIENLRQCGTCIYAADLNPNAVYHVDSVVLKDNNDHNDNCFCRLCSAPVKIKLKEFPKLSIETIKFRHADAKVSVGEVAPVVQGKKKRGRPRKNDVVVKSEESVVVISESKKIVKEEYNRLLEERKRLDDRIAVLEAQLE